MKYKRDDVSYNYVVGDPEMSKRYRIIKMHRVPESGNFQCDIEDFKSFFNNLPVDVYEIHLTTRKGIYRWRRDQGWLYFGR